MAGSADNLGPFANSAAHIERIVQAFEEAWQQGNRVSIDEFLYATGADSRSLLIELVHTDLECRLKAGEAARAETYLQRYPELASDANVVLELLATEFRLRRRQEPDLALDDYSSRFPEYADRLGKLLESSPPQPDEQRTVSYAVPDPYRTVDTPDQEGVASQRSQGGASAIIPGYELLGTLGRGGMGVVYKARHLKLKRIVALKMILGGGHAGPDLLDRFRREAEAVARIQHPNIVQIYEVGEADGRPFFSLEFVSGGSLDKQIKGTTLPARRAGELVETLARAMNVAHDNGIVHRDLKPANVLLTADGTPKITDFGLAKELEDDSGQTRSGAVMGTPSYMAPEQASGLTSSVGPVADVYALGAILYDLLTGRPPFKGATTLDTLDQVRNQDPVPPSRLQPKTPRDLETICLKCLQKAPASRYASGNALAGDLRRWLNGEPIQARPTPAWERTAKWVRRRPTAALLAGVLFLSVVGSVASGFVYQHQQVRFLEKELTEQRRQDTVRAQANDLVRDGHRAAAEERWLDARTLFANALTVITAEPSLEDLRAEAEEHVRRAGERVADKDARQEAQEERRQFERHRDEALFAYGTRFTGREPRATAAEVGRAAGHALALFGTAPDKPQPPVVSRYHSERDKTEIVNGCYELLLILAETRALGPPEQPAPERAKGALRLLDQASRFHAPTQALAMRRARYLAQLGDAPAALQEQEAAKKLKPDSAVDYFLLGDEWYKRGDAAQAVAHFDQTLRLQPDHFWAQLFLAVRYLEAQRPGDAKAGLTACLARRPRFLWCYLLRGIAHAGAGEFDNAEADFRAVLSDFEPDESARYVVHVYRGGMRTRQGKFDEAVADLEAALALKPDQAEAYESLAQTRRSQKDNAAAAQTLARGLKRVTEPARLYRLGAQFQREDSDAAGALRDIEEAIRRAPAGSLLAPQLLLERGQILLGGLRYADAVRAFEAVLAEHPSRIEAHLGRAEALMELQKYADAARACEQYFEKGKPTAYAYRTRGRARAKLDDYPAAVADFNKAIALEPDDYVYGQRGWAYTFSDAWKFALYDFDEALRLNARSGLAYTGRGYARARLGQYQEAAADAAEALRHGPSKPDYLLNVACVYAQAAAQATADLKQPGRQAVALQYEKRALELLRQALDKVPLEQRPAFWQQLAVDADLESLRKNPGFNRLRPGQIKDTR